jgi:hypothetical protein
MVLFLLAYADWNAFGVAESTTGTDAGHGHDHAHDGDGHGHDHSHVHDDHDHAHSHDGAGHSNDHAHDHDGHDGSTMELLIDHLREDAYALVSKSTEAAAAIVLSILAITER